jgi:hypothetical protein
VKPGGAAALEARFGTLIEGLALVASVALLAMVAIICADVLTRNVAIPGMPRGVAWSNEISELLLYLITLLAAPWLLREGRHIRVDIAMSTTPLLTALPTSNVGIAFGPPMKLICSVPLPSALNCWIHFCRWTT